MTCAEQGEVEVESAAAESKDSPPTGSTRAALLTEELYLELLIIRHRASLNLLMLNAG